MLDVLLGEEIYNVAVVVTRYFGGVLLGTGGLVRAYSKGSSGRTGRKPGHREKTRHYIKSDYRLYRNRKNPVHSGRT